MKRNPPFLEGCDGGFRFAAPTLPIYGLRIIQLLPLTGLLLYAILGCNIYQMGAAVYLFYTDESGSPYRRESVLNRLVSRRSKQDPWYVLGTLCISENFRPVIAEYFTRMKESFFPGWDPSSKETEIKGEKLHNYMRLAQSGQWGTSKPPKGPWSNLQASQVVSLYRSVFDIMKKVKATLYVAALHQRRICLECRRRGLRMWPANFHALALLQQRACQFLEYEVGRVEQGVFIIDRHSNLQMEYQYAEFLSIRDAMNRTASWPVAFDNYLIEEPLAVDSHLVPLIQLVDVVTYSVAKGIKKGIGHPSFRAVEPYLARRWGSDEYLGAGLELVPRIMRLQNQGQAR